MYTERMRLSLCPVRTGPQGRMSWTRKALVWIILLHLVAWLGLLYRPRRHVDTEVDIFLYLSTVVCTDDIWGARY